MSILTLVPEELGKRIAQTIQVDLSLECIGIFTYDEKSDVLSPLAFSSSERLGQSLKDIGLSFEGVGVTKISASDFFSEIIVSHKEQIVNSLGECWVDIFERKKLEQLAVDSHLKTTLYFPLVVEKKAIGMLMLGLNRNYESLTNFERESINSFRNVISLALEKANLYQRLESANIYLRELDRQKDELLGIVSHQLAAPVTSMKWYLEMMANGEMGELQKDAKETVMTMQATALNLADLVSMILDVSRIQLGRIRVDKSPLPLHDFFKEIIATIEPKVVEKHIDFEVKMPAKLPTVLLDKRYTRMTVENMLTNAVKYTPEKGKVQFTVEQKGKKLLCKVQDTGCGIPASEQDKIFGKLFRASNVRNTVDGNGFGLFVAKGAIEAQGGKMWFESTEGKGSTFFIELPMVYEDKGGKAKKEPEASPEAPAGEKVGE